MRTMYDAVNAANIPPGAVMVAGYIDRIKLLPWSAADWARFPAAVHVTIVKKASTNDGHVLDVEPGDATPAEAPGWVLMRRVAGADPTVYCSWSAWPSVRAAFRAAGVAEPHYWIARYDGDPTIPAGAVAKQYRGNVAPGYDVSSVADYWPGVDSPAHSNAGGGAPSGSRRPEESTVELKSGTNLSRSFDIPAWAKQIRINCPEGFLTAHAVILAGDGFPKTKAADGQPDFDWKWSNESDFRVDRLRPWWITVPDGATQGEIRWTLDPAHPERTGSLDFR